MQSSLFLFSYGSYIVEQFAVGTQSEDFNNESTRTIDSPGCCAINIRQSGCKRYRSFPVAAWVSESKRDRRIPGT